METERKTVTFKCSEYGKRWCGVWAWTPVEDGLPEDGEMKLVTCRAKNGHLSVNRAYYMNGYWHGQGSMARVTAWMDLPDPYDDTAEEGEPERWEPDEIDRACESFYREQQAAAYERMVETWTN